MAPVRTKRVSEKSIDRVFVAGVKRLGGITIKLSTLGMRGTSGWPDRLVLLPGGVVCFVELKAPGKRPTPLQHQRLAKLDLLGFSASWFDDAAEALVFVAGRADHV